MLTLPEIRTVVEFLRGEIAGDMPLYQLAMLLYIADNEGCALVDMEKTLNIPYATVARNCMLLATYSKKVKDKPILMGHDLVEDRTDRFERRRKSYYLTPKGKKFIGRFKEVIAGGSDRKG